MAIADATKLRLFNAALRLIRETKLGSLSEDREPQYVLNDIWDDGAINACLEMGIWHFATRTIALTYAPSITPAFGKRYAFTQPDDYIRLVGIWQDEFESAPLLDYRENGGYWFADLDTIYLSYVSNDNAYGTDFSLWPDSFRFVVESFLASKLAYGITCSNEVKDVADLALKKSLINAKSLGAMSQPTRFSPPSSWSRARAEGGYRRGDGGSNSRLIG